MTTSERLTGTTPNRASSQPTRTDPSAHHPQLRRPLLIFNHNAKAGGGSILEILEDIKPLKRIYGERVDSLSRIVPSQNSSSVDSFFIYVREEKQTTNNDRQYGYIIGSVREPCSQYVSLWAFGSTGKGAFRNYNTIRDAEQLELWGKDSPPYFNSTSDIKRFHNWLQHPKVHGRIAHRFVRSYGGRTRTTVAGASGGGTTITISETSILDSVDCWVRVENFQSSLLDCLLRYELQGGYVNWTRPKVQALLQRTSRSKTSPLNNDHHRGHRYLSRASRNYASSSSSLSLRHSEKVKYDGKDKNDPFGNPQLLHHDKCELYYNTNLAKQVETGPEYFIYQIFGYYGCCSKQYNESILVTPKTPIVSFDDEVENKKYPKYYDDDTENDTSLLFTIPDTETPSQESYFLSSTLVTNGSTLIIVVTLLNLIGVVGALHQYLRARIAAKQRRRQGRDNKRVSVTIG